MKANPNHPYRLVTHRKSGTGWVEADTYSSNQWNPPANNQTGFYSDPTPNDDSQSGCETTMCYLYNKGSKQVPFWAFSRSLSIKCIGNVMKKSLNV